MKKPTLKFFPNRTKISKKDGLIPVYFRIIQKTKKIEGRLPLQLSEKQAKTWLSDYLNPESNLNHNLAKYRMKFNEYLTYSNVQNESLEPIKNHLLGVDDKTILPNRITVKQYFENYYKDFVLTDSTKRSGTKVNYKKAFDNIDSFLKQKNIEELLLSALPRTFGAEFANYLISERINYDTKTKEKCPVKRPMQGSTVNGYMKKIKSVFYKARNEGEISFDPFYKVKIKDNSKVKKNLSIYQIRDIMLLNLKSKPALEKYRNTFLMQFFTGCAFTDTTLIQSIDFIETIHNHIKLTGDRIKSYEPFEQIATKHLLSMVYFMRKIYDLKENIIPKIEITSYNEALQIIGELANVNFKITSHHARSAFHQAILDGKILDVKAEYKMMGWSRKNAIDEKYGKVNDEILLDATTKLEEYFDKHLTNHTNGNLILFE